MYAEITPGESILSDSGKTGETPSGTRLLVAFLTYKRGPLLDLLLESCAALRLPEGIALSFLVVDNDPAASAQGRVAAFRHRLANLTYLHEPRRGIPVARNAALDHGLVQGFDAMCFVDDDEVLHPDWLLHLVATWRQSGAHLVGGPVEVAQPPTEATGFQRFVNESLAARMRRKNARSARRARQGAAMTVVTNNWLCDLNWLRGRGLRFDETQLFTGGSDATFCAAMRRAGARIVWSPDALVYETMTPDRLTLRYQFHRGASQSMNNFQLKNPRLTAGAVATAMVMAALKFLLGAALFMLPVFGKASPTIAMRSMGWSLGRMKALAGVRSRLYQTE